MRLFKNSNFATSNVMFLMLGAVLFSSTVLVPQLLQTLIGYTAEEAGLVLSLGAVAILFFLPLVGKLTTRVQARFLTATGWLLLAVSMYLSARQTDLLISFGNASLPRVLQSVPLPFLFVPLTLARYIGLPSEKTNSAAGLMDFMRTMGQSIGTSSLTTVLPRRDQFHQSILADYTASPRFQAVIQSLAGQLHHVGLGMAVAQHQAIGRLYNLVQAQAAALSYIDAYWLLAVAGTIMFLGSFLFKPNDPRKGGSVAIH